MKYILCLLMLAPALLNAQNSEGPHDPSLAENTSCPFSYSSVLDYLPAENAFASDDQYATVSHCDCCDANTKCFQSSGYGFNIPLSAIIDGIIVEVEKKASSGSMIQDNGLKLLKAGAVTGSSYATADNWPFADTYSTYGGAGDLWGTTWLPSEINDEGFGLAIATISYTCTGNGIPAISYIDHIRITIYFTDEATGISSSTSSNSSSMIISPNPSANGDLSLSFPLVEKRIQLFVTDVVGKIVEEKMLEPEGGTAKYSSSLSHGVYILSARGASNVYVEKLVVK